VGALLHPRRRHLPPVGPHDLDREQERSTTDMELAKSSVVCVNGGGDLESWLLLSSFAVTDIEEARCRPRWCLVQNGVPGRCLCPRSPPFTACHARRPAVPATRRNPASGRPVVYALLTVAAAAAAAATHLQSAAFSAVDGRPILRVAALARRLAVPASDRSAGAHNLAPRPRRHARARRAAAAPHGRRERRMRGCARAAPRRVLPVLGTLPWHG
jgi:hypothetical protein